MENILYNDIKSKNRNLSIFVFIKKYKLLCCGSKYYKKKFR